MSGTNNKGTGSQNYTSPVNLAIPYTMPPSVPDALKGVIKPLYIAFQNLIQTMINACGIAPRAPGQLLTLNGDPSTILTNNMHRFYIQASEAISYGSLITFVANLGTLQVKNALATSAATRADGFCSQPGGIQVGQTGEVIIHDGVIFGVSGLTTGSRYYLSPDVPGHITAVAPTVVGDIEQYVGIALTSTDFKFWSGHVVQH